MKQFTCVITPTSLRFGTINLPAEFAHLLPSDGKITEILVHFDGSETPSTLKYQPQFRTLSGLREWYKVRKAKVDDKLSFIQLRPGVFIVTLIPKRRDSFKLNED